MKAFTYEILLKQPVLATTLLGDPNSSVSFPYLPGSLLRGLLIHRYLDQRSIADPTGDPDCRRLFFGGETRYLHAYPIGSSGARSLPTPRSWLIGKHASSDAAEPAALFDASLASWTPAARAAAEASDQLTT